MRDVFASFDYHNQIDRLARADLRHVVAHRFAALDPHPARVGNAHMGASARS